MERKAFRYPGWELVGKLGKGSYGSVYEISRDLGKSQEHAALKVLSIPNEEDLNDLRQSGYDKESLTETFKQQKQEIVEEYALTQKLGGNTNIVNVHDVTCVQHDDDLGWDIFIRMELLTPLTQIVEKSTLPEYQIVKLGKDLCRALSLCEKNNILHRDIKPQNIFISQNADYKLGDFGIAKIAESTRSGSKAGTFKFMAPEIYNNRPYGSKSDLYSLGLVMYWLLNEKCAPFMPLPPAKKTANDENLGRQRRFDGEPIPPPAHGSGELKAIVCKACAFRPEDRFSNAQEMLEALETLYVCKETIVIPPPKVEPISFQADSPDSFARHIDIEANQSEKDSQSSSDGRTRRGRKTKEELERIEKEKQEKLAAEKRKAEERRKKLQKKLVIIGLSTLTALLIVFGLTHKPPLTPQSTPTPSPVTYTPSQSTSTPKSNTPTPAPTPTSTPSPAPTTIYGKQIENYHHGGVEPSFRDKIDCITQTYQSRFEVDGTERKGPISQGYSSTGYEDNKYGFYFADGLLYFIEGRSDGVTNLGLYYWDGKLIAVHDITGAGKMFVEGDYVFERVRDDYQKLYDIAMNLERVG